MQERYRAADRSTHLHHNGSNFAEWVTSINRVLCIALNTELFVDYLPSSFKKLSPQEHRAISHFINATLPPNFALCIGIVPARTTAKEFFGAIKARCFPGNCFQKLKMVKDVLDLLVENGAGQHKLNSAIILSLCKSFLIFKKLGIDADELEGLLAQAACHAPPSLDHVAFDQLVTSAILAKGDEKPSSTFVGQVILNTLRRDDKQTSLPFIYHMSGTQDHQPLHSRPCLPYFAKPMGSTSNVRCPPEHLMDKSSGSCFHCGGTSHWQANCLHTKGFANQNPRLVSLGPLCSPCPGTPDRRSQNLSSPHYQRERVLQVKFVESDVSDCVLIDTGASINLSGSARFVPNLKAKHQDQVPQLDSRGHGESNGLPKSEAYALLAFCLRLCEFHAQPNSQLSVPQVISPSRIIQSGALHQDVVPSWRQCYCSCTRSSPARKAHTKGNGVQAIKAIHDWWLATLGPHTNKMIQSASVIFPKFQPYGQPKTPGKASLSHIVRAINLGKVPTEQYFEEEN
ncbi:hypothetical protein O181_077280 [Austropuccinia psidii MF-1]|uniref:Uncharacterized protein n=1 Tax=Austropuccinia psidii MF-1 TaxID=1389203 RepID=A0A9Q3IFU0_9BASI|nr:hypothetical protein [Austropuccinia psidii MF-1]